MVQLLVQRIKVIYLFVFLFFAFFTDLSYQILLVPKLDNHEIDQPGICLESVSNKPNRFFFCFPKDYQVTYVFTENDNLRKPKYKLPNIITSL